MQRNHDKRTGSRDRPTSQRRITRIGMDPAVCPLVVAMTSCMRLPGFVSLLFIADRRLASMLLSRRRRRWRHLEVLRRRTVLMHSRKMLPKLLGDCALRRHVRSALLDALRQAAACVRSIQKAGALLDLVMVGARRGGKAMGCICDWSTVHNYEINFHNAVL